MELEEKIEIIREAESLVEGKIKMRNYKELSYKNDEIPSINRIIDGHKWNDVIAAAFPGRIKTIEDAGKAARIAKEKSGEDNLKITTYTKYARKLNAPGYCFIKNRMTWKEFKAKYVDENILEYREIFEQKVEEEFCKLCNEKEECGIELENCEYWREWNENKQQNFG